MQIVLTSGEGITGLVIRTYTWSWAAHAGFRLDDGTYLDATPSKGVSVHKGIAGRRVQVFNFLATTDEIALIRRFLQRQLGKPYDWSAIYGMAIRRDWHDPRKWFCSELVAAAFEAAGRPLLRTEHLDRVTPRDILMSPYLKPARR